MSWRRFVDSAAVKAVKDATEEVHPKREAPQGRVFTKHRINAAKRKNRLTGQHQRR